MELDEFQNMAEFSTCVQELSEATKVLPVEVDQSTRHDTYDPIQFSPIQSQMKADFDSPIETSPLTVHVI